MAYFYRNFSAQFPPSIYGRLLQSNYSDVFWPQGMQAKLTARGKDKFSEISEMGKGVCFIVIRTGKGSENNWNDFVGF